METENVKPMRPVPPPKGKNFGKSASEDQPEGYPTPPESKPEPLPPDPNDPIPPDAG
jgi:hypothetical protein